MSPRMLDLWSLFGLRESPFFQDTLAPGSPYPTELFVGRTAETDNILSTVGSSVSSRQLLHGPPGIGKTTLAQHAKDLLSREGFVVRWRPVGVTAEQGSAALLVDILASVHEAVLTALPPLGDSDPMQAARGLVRSFRQTSIGGGVSVLGNGIEGTKQTTYVRPVDAGVMQEAWRILLDLTALACGEHDARGIIVHLNNLENLASAEDFENAARAFRNLRDLFLAPNLHWLIVGTSEEALGILGAYPQVRSVFLPSHPALTPLSRQDFLALLQARYRHLRSEGREVIQPVDDDAASAVYELFHGDLRGTLRTLEQGCLALGGLTDGEPVRPLNYVELIATLRPAYAAEMLAELSETMVERMREIAELRDEGVTQGQLQGAWKVTRQRVSQVIGELERRGYVQEVRTRGRSKVYSLTGTGIIALGLEGNG